MSTEPLRAAIYARVSTEDQAREGFSLDAQVKRLEAYCRARGWKIFKVYVEEGQSGRDTRRPAYQEMMADRDDWDLILVLKMDRIHRNSVNFTLMMDELRRHGKEFNSIQESFDTTTAMGRFVMDIMQRIAQLESEQIGERVYVGMRKKASDGDLHLGSAHPYGYECRDGELHLIPEEAAVLERMFRMRAKGTSYQAIADALNHDEIPSKRGLTWSRQAVWRIVNNPLHQGYRRWGGMLGRGSHVAPHAEMAAASSNEE